MSAKEKAMAELLARDDRAERFSAVIAHINPDVSAILDLDCGIGALTTRLADRFSSALIVGVDRSKYLLSMLQGKRNVSTVLGDIPNLPLKEGFFDLVVSVQVLHEILCFKGADALFRTLQNVFGLLKKDGEFIIFDHVNPSDTPISLRMPDEPLTKLHEFQSKFKPRTIIYDHLGEGRIKTSMRNFYDFVTRIWALNSELEEEMSETHTAFTCQELVNLIQETGFEVVHIDSLTPMDRCLGYYGIILESAVKRPNRHILLQARKKFDNTEARASLNL
jgi:SAM-dependent methyltransferase